MEKRKAVAVLLSRRKEIRQLTVEWKEKRRSSDLDVKSKRTNKPNKKSDKSPSRFSPFILHFFQVDIHALLRGMALIGGALEKVDVEKIVDGDAKRHKLRYLIVEWKEHEIEK